MTMPPPDRLPPIDPSQWTDAQRIEAQAIIDGPRRGLISPFIPLIRSPELMGHAQRMGEYLRYRSALELRLSELAILVTARAWSQTVEWNIHAPIAIKAGVGAAVVAAIGAGHTPVFAKDDEAIVYAFCDELQRTQHVSEPTWQRAISTFGEHATMDLIGISGYYTFLSMVMNAAHTPAPNTDAPPLAP